MNAVAGNSDYHTYEEFSYYIMPYQSSTLQRFNHIITYINICIYVCICIYNISIYYIIVAVIIFNLID